MVTAYPELTLELIDRIPAIRRIAFSRVGELRFRRAMKCAPEESYRMTAFTLANATINFFEK
jgi:hypothetical protein